MHRRTTRTNHVALVLLGLILLATGGYLIARNRGRLDRQPASARIYTRYESHWLHHHDWVWYAVAAAAIVVGLLALRWVLVQPRIDRLRSVRLDPDPDQAGRTVLAADVLTDTIEDDVADLPGVARVRALLLGAGDDPQLILRVQAYRSIDLGALNERIVTESLPAVRTALDSPDVPAQVHLLIAGRDTATRAVH